MFTHESNGGCIGFQMFRMRFVRDMHQTVGLYFLLPEKIPQPRQESVEKIPVFRGIRRDVPAETLLLHAVVFDDDFRREPRSPLSEQM